MLQCAVSDADIVTGVLCHASTFLISAGNTATPAYPVANRTLSDIRICTVLAPRMGIEPIQHFHMPLLALSMPPTYVIGIEPISHYVIRTLLIAIFRIDAVWICTTQQLTKLSPQANIAIRVSHSLFAHYWLKFYSNLYYSVENASSIPPRIN